MTELIPIDRIERKIYFLRGRRVMLDHDIAELYGVTVGNLNKAVKRNKDRFPDDFIFQLTQAEDKSLRFQIGILDKPGRGQHRKYLPYAFTEQGVAMLSSVLNSKRAVQVNIQIMRVFVRLNQYLLTHRELQQKLEAMGKKYDKQFKIVFDTIRHILEAPVKQIQVKGFERK